MQHYDNLILHTDAKGISEIFVPDREIVAPGIVTVKGRDSIKTFLDQFKNF